MFDYIVTVPSSSIIHGNPRRTALYCVAIPNIYFLVRRICSTPYTTRLLPKASGTLVPCPIIIIIIIMQIFCSNYFFNFYYISARVVNA